MSTPRFDLDTKALAVHLAATFGVLEAARRTGAAPRTIRGWRQRLPHDPPLLAALEELQSLNADVAEAVNRAAVELTDYLVRVAREPGDYDPAITRELTTALVGLLPHTTAGSPLQDRLDEAESKRLRTEIRSRLPN